MSAEFFGWLGSIFFSICALPQAIKAIRDGHATGISLWYLILWLLGELCMIAYIWERSDLPLMVNYVMNLGFFCIIARYKVFPKRKGAEAPPSTDRLNQS
jgi:uncharacterized protein with PQ loop repeat